MALPSIFPIFSYSSRATWTCPEEFGLASDGLDFKCCSTVAYRDFTAKECLFSPAFYTFSPQ